METLQLAEKQFDSKYHCGTMECIGDSFKKRTDGMDKIILIQVNKGFKVLAINLICSILKTGIPKHNVQVWAMDSTVHEYMLTLGIHSYYEPKRYFGTQFANNYHSANYYRMMRQRGEFWKNIVKMKLDFWWIDADVSLLKDIRD
jgi:hypothetical protein